LIQQACLGEAIYLGVEVKTLEDVAYGWREGLDVTEQIFTDVILIAHQLLHVQWRGVVETLPRFAQQEWLWIQPGLLLFIELGQHGWLGCLKHAIQSAQNGERQDDLAVFGLFVIAT